MENKEVRNEQIKSLDPTSKAGQLARELNAERSRLKKEMEEIQEHIVTSMMRLSVSIESYLLISVQVKASILVTQNKKSLSNV